MHLYNQGESLHEISNLLVSLLSATAGLAVGRVWDSLSEKRKERQEIVTQYLSQLQDAVDTLWSRINGIISSPQSYDFESRYFKNTNVYAVGRVLAIERLITERGLYSIIHKHDKKLNKFLQDHHLHRLLTSFGFHRFERMSLAETLIELHGTQYIVIGPDRFDEICTKREHSKRPMPDSAWNLMPTLMERRPDMDRLLQKLRALSFCLEKQTNIKSTIRHHERPKDSQRSGMLQG